MTRLENLARLPVTGPGPKPRAGYVSRPHLVARLIRAQASIALIAAPAGYGKTTLAREWDGWDDRPFAWVTVEPEHDDDCASALKPCRARALSGCRARRWSREP